MKNSKLNAHQEGVLIVKIIDWHLNGKTRSEIIPLIKENSPGQDLNDASCNELIEQSYKDLEQMSSLDFQKMVETHVVFYEKIYSYFHSIEKTDGENKSMRLKERILGLHRKPKSEITAPGAMPPTLTPIFNVDLLSMEQKARLEYLLEKSNVK